MKLDELNQSCSEVKRFYIILAIITFIVCLVIILASLEVIVVPENYSGIIFILLGIVALIVYSVEKIYALLYEIKLNTMPKEVTPKPNNKKAN